MMMICTPLRIWVFLALLLLVFVPSEAAFTVRRCHPQQSFCQRCRSSSKPASIIVRPRNKASDEDPTTNAEEENSRRRVGIFRGIQDVAGGAASRLVKEGGSGVILSAANATTSRLLADLAAGKGGSGVVNAIGSTSARLSDIAVRGGSGVVSVANTTTSRLADLAGKGGSGVLNAVGSTSARLSEIAGKGASDVRYAANVATTGLIGLAEKGASDVVSMANATTYNAGEVVRWIDLAGKEGANAASARSQSLVLGFTGKKEYRFGDISKELLRRIAAAEYDLNDILLLLKITLAVGASFGPLAKVLPITVLLDMFNVSLEKQVGGKVLGVLGSSLDDRFTAAFTNDDKFLLGDAVKRSAMAGILKFTGKDSYEEGDIERAIADKGKTKKESDKDGGDLHGSLATQQTLNVPVGPEFEIWDKKFREAHPDLDLSAAEVSSKDLDMTIAKELAEEGAFFATTPPDSKFCVFCGTNLPRVAKYCSSCGEQQQPYERSR